MSLEDRLVKKALSDASEADKTEIVLLRAKLEVRTWFLRVSIALNTSFIAGIVIQLLRK
jgi:hypothetical protein